MDNKLAQWVLRIGIAGEFIGHGLLAIRGKEDWVKWITMMIGTNAETSASLLLWVGVFDVFIAIIVLLRPIPAALLWAAFWGFWTALVRPLVGLDWLDFVERSANWAAPLALLLLIGWPKSLKEWFLPKGSQ